MSPSIERELADKLHEVELTIASGFAQIHSTHDKVTDDLALVAKNQDRIVKSIYGNGQEGLLTKVARISQSQKWLWSFCASAVGLQLGLVAFYLKQLPILA